jgi:type I restriction enzyme, S subunit
VIEGLKPYSSYESAKLAWLTKTPSHWALKRLGAIFEERRETNEARDVDQVLSVVKDIGVIRYEDKGRIGNKKSEDTARYKIVRPNDLVLNSMNVIIGSVGLSRFTGCLSPVYYVLQARSVQDDPKYLEAIFRVREFQKSLVRIGNGILAHRMRIPMELLKCEMLPLPALEEQKAIVRFLEHANHRIDRYIRAKRKLIALLNEQKQAIIHRAVTRGLDEGVPMKDSGVPWLGEIPAHWELKRVKQVSRISRGKFTHRPRNDPSLYDGKYPFIQTGAVARANKYISDYKQTLNEMGLAVSTLFTRGTLLMTIAANIGDVAILDFDSCLPDSIIGFFPTASTDRDFMYFLFSIMKSEFLSEAPVNTQGNLNVDRVGSMPIPVPSIDEQREIVSYIEKEIVLLEAGISAAKHEIALMNEYRTRLVADVVTGQLDVRDAAKGLPDLTEVHSSLEIEHDPDMLTEDEDAPIINDEE